MEETVRDTEPADTDDVKRRKPRTWVDSMTSKLPWKRKQSSSSPSRSGSIISFFKPNSSVFHRLKNADPVPFYGTSTPEVLSRGKKSTDRKNFRNFLAFFMCGLFNNFGFVVMLSAAEDIIEKNSELEDFIVPTGAVLLAGIIPALIIKMTAPWLMDRLAYSIRIWILMITGVISFHIVAWFRSSVVNIAGVCSGSVAVAFGEITFLALSSRYNKNTVSTWSSGTGLSGLLGSGFYLAFTSWIKMPFDVTLSIASVAPIIVGVTYFFILGEEDVEDNIYTTDHAITRSHSEGDINTSTVTKSDIVRYSSVIPKRDNDTASRCSSEDWAGGDEENLLGLSPKHSQLAQKQQATPVVLPLPLKLKLKFLMHLMPFMIPLFIVYFAEYTINQGVSPVLVFKNAPFEKRDHYVYYMFLYQTGVFISRSSVNFAPIKFISVPSFLQGANLIFLIVNTLLGLIRDVYIIFFIIFWEGLLGGSVYVNAFYLISQEVSPKYREFAMGLASVADSMGICLAGLVSVFLQPWLSANKADF